MNTRKQKIEFLSGLKHGKRFIHELQEQKLIIKVGCDDDPTKFFVNRKEISSDQVKQYIRHGEPITVTPPLY